MPSSKKSSYSLKPIINQSGSSRSSSRDSSATFESTSSRDSSDRFTRSIMGQEEKYYKSERRNRVPDHPDHYVSTKYSQSGRVAVTNHKKTGYDESEPRSRDASAAEMNSKKDRSGRRQ